MKEMNRKSQRALIATTLLLTLLSSVVVAGKLGLFQAHSDVGITPKKGSVKYSPKSGEYKVTGGGANIWAKADAFQFTYKKLSGDLTFTADVKFVGEGVEHHRKAALMIRQGLEPDAPYADVALHGDGLTSLQYRETAGEITKEARSEVKAPGRIQIERHGSAFTIAVGNSGSEMKTTGPVTVELKDPVYVGLVVCSHNANVLETAIFSHVELKGASEQTANRFELLAAR